MATISKDQAIALIFVTMDEMNAALAPDRQLEKSPTTALFGSSSKLDSLGLVNLIVAVEQRLADDYSLAVTLADEKAMSQRNSPFRSVDALADYVLQLAKEA